MDSIAPYHLSRHEDGTWHVIDAETGGPAEIDLNGEYFLLWKMPRKEAEEWSRLLNEKAKAARRTTAGAALLTAARQRLWRRNKNLLRTFEAL